ncbi:MAG: hypothetical protein AAFX85_02475, partial [Pseudomonadota bacterium]
MQQRNERATPCLCAALLLACTAGPALADAPSTQATDTTPRMGTALRWDHVDLTLAELAAKLPPVRTVAPSREVPNQLQPLVLRPRDELAQDPLAGNGLNPLSMPSVLRSFEGPSSDDNQAVTGNRIMPPDTNGDVSENFVVSYVNLVWRVYDKAGNPIGGALAGNTFWAGFGGACETNNDGDPIVLYDHVARRWVFSQFAPRSGIQCFALSDTEDPNSGLTRYAFLVEPAAFNDYPKIGVWVSADGTQSAYTYTGRNFIPQASPTTARDITAVLFDRNAMLSGAAAAFVSVVVPGGFTNFDGLQPGHVESGNLAPGGACPLFTVADAPNLYRFFEFCENFPGNGAFTTLPTVAVATFDNGLGNVPAPGGNSMATLAAFTMYRASHANIGGEHRLAVAHTVDAGGDRAGMRWTILDVDNYSAITVIDQGTFAPNDGRERWMGAVTLDQVGNLGMGYTRGGGADFPSVFVTGREVGDPAGTLQAESECVLGTGSQTGGTRWGDYSSTSLDPADGCTFWTFQEYVATTGSFEWNTRVCAFSFPSCQSEPGDLGWLPAVL